MTYGQSLLAWPLGQGQSHFQFTGRTCGMGIRRGTGILCRTGIRRGTGILPVSSLFSGGQDTHSTPIQREDSARQEKRLLWQYLRVFKNLSPRMRRLLTCLATDCSCSGVKPTSDQRGVSIGPGAIELTRSFWGAS